LFIVVTIIIPLSISISAKLEINLSKRIWSERWWYFKTY